MTEAVVEFDYKAKEPDELNIKKGDIITDISIKPGGWWEGTLNGGKRGMFPDNFVKLIKNEDGEPLPASTGRKCKVLFAYEPLNSDELRLHVGDVIDIISEVEEGWWKGGFKHKIGVFPSNFVVEISDTKSEVREASQRKQKISRDESVSHTIGSITNTSESQNNKSESSPDLPTLPPKPAKEYYRALYRYDAENVDELTIQPGDIITLLTKDGQDPGWWKGELKGKVGFFPDNFVEVITYEEATKGELKTKLFSKVGAAISKSATTSSICESSTSSVTRKFSDTSKISEDKLPPSVSKKPVLPPPPKKPQSSIPANKHMESPPSSQSAKVLSSSNTTIKHSSSTASDSNVSATNANNTGSSKWTVVETSDSMDGISWSKQSSYSLKNESSKMSSSTISSVSFNSTSNATGTNELDLDMVGRASMLTHPTASRAKAPKRRPPSAIINLPTTFSLKEEMSNGEESPPLTLLNGDADTHVEKPISNQQPPWVGELKLSQAKKSMQGKTRVMIGMSNSTESIVSPESKVSTTNTSAISSATSSSSSSLVTLRQQPVIGPRPQSLMSSLKSVTSQSGDTVIISFKQWNELLERVSSLESNFESQIVALTKAVKDMASKLDDETQKRIVMQQELEKLTDLVTQV